jgi:branched-subunit amino acid ABC-type transport system permease component
MIQTVIYGFTIGAILYFFSIGLSLTFGTMHIINFAHGMVYTLGVYLFITLMKPLGNSFLLSLIVSLAAMLPVGYLIERFVIRRLYGESLDYAIIATYGVLLIGTDLIKLVWGTTPYPVSDPVGLSVPLAGMDLPVYRILIVVCAVVLYLALRLFFNRSIIGRIVTAALEDSDGVRCLGLDVNRYFSIVFVIGSALAVLGGILYAPISSAEPYMGFHILLLAFAVVIVGGMGNLNGTFVAAMVLGMVMAVTGRFWSQASNAVVFFVMALVIIFRPVEAE